MAHLLVGYTVSVAHIDGTVTSSPPKLRRTALVPLFEAMVAEFRGRGFIVTISGDEATVWHTESGLPVGMIRIHPLTVEV